MVQPITDQAAFLSEASRKVQELSEQKGSLEKLRLEEKKLEKELEAEKRAVADSISITVRKRIEEINNTYDQEINKGQDRLKKTRSRREKAKSQGIKERIAEETSELTAHNRELMVQMKTLFQKERIPGYCKSGWYYSIFFTRGFTEILTLLATVLVCFLLIPCAVYFMIPEKTPWYLIGIYFATIVVFGGMYVLISNRTKMHHQAALKEGRAIRDVIKSNNKKIRVITSTIRRDRDEAVYNLEKYDDEISRLEQELADIANKKKEALNTFDKVTKTIISDEIANSSRERIEKMETDLAQILSDSRTVEAQIKEKTLYIIDNYESYVGKEFMIPERLDELADLIRVKKAATISEAESLYRDMHN